MKQISTRLTPAKHILNFSEVKNSSFFDRLTKSDLGYLKDWARVVYWEEGRLIQTN